MKEQIKAYSCHKLEIKMNKDMSSESKDNNIEIKLITFNWLCCKINFTDQR